MERITLVDLNAEDTEKKIILLMISESLLSKNSLLKRMLLSEGFKIISRETTQDKLYGKEPTTVIVDEVWPEVTQMIHRTREAEVPVPYLDKNSIDKPYGKKYRRSLRGK